MLYAVTCHFNPVGFERPRRNYREFRDRLEAPLLTIEASFDGTFHCNPDLAIQACRRCHTLWQKERMLNLAIEMLPPNAEKVAWIDADLLFDSPDWYETASNMLDEFPVVQLFDQVDRLGPNRDVQHSHPSMISRVRDGSRRWGAPGFAWAARRETLDALATEQNLLSGPLFDLDVVGANDVTISAAFLGKPTYALGSNPPPKLGAAARRWSRAAWGHVVGKIGCVPGKIRHLFHGAVGKRQYHSRMACLRSSDFDPATDIQIDENGLWTWSSHKKRLHDQVAQYLAGRDEDDDGNAVHFGRNGLSLGQTQQVTCRNCSNLRPTG